MGSFDFNMSKNEKQGLGGLANKRREWEMTKIEELMHKRGISNIRLARALEVSEGSTSAWKRGIVCVPSKHRQKLAEALGVKVEEILDARGLAKLADGGDGR